MKALVFDGDDLQLKDVPVPEPDKNEALIKVLYTGICNTDMEILKGYMNFTGILGHEFVGVVEKAPYSEWVGKRVVGEINIACGTCDFCRQGLKSHCQFRKVLGISGKDGTMAEYVTLPLANLHVVPPDILDLEAVFVEPLAAAVEILEQLKFLKEYRVLLLGDGKLAQLIAQVLKVNNIPLQVVGKHTNKLKILQEQNIPVHLKEDFQEKEHSFHVVIEATGSWEGWEMALQFVRPRGFIVLKSTYTGEFAFNPAELVVNEITVLGSRCGPFLPAISLLDRGKIELEPLISGVYPLKDYKEAFQKAQEPGTLKIILQP